MNSRTVRYPDRKGQDRKKNNRRIRGQVQHRSESLYAPVPQERNRRPIKKKRGAFAEVIHRLRKGTKEEQYFDYDLLLIVVFLFCFGLVMLYSASSYDAFLEIEGDDLFYFRKQAEISIIGFICMYVASKLDYHYYGAFGPEILLIAMVAMALVQTPLGVTTNGARRWIGIGGITVQPAEFTKIAVILFISYLLCRLGKKAYPLKGIITVLAFGMIAAAGVMFLTDNLSTAIIVMAISCILVFVNHPKTKPFLILVAAATVILIVVVAFLAVKAQNSSNFRIGRIISWLNPEATADDGSFQLIQGLYAIGSGGFFGKGLGNSTQKLTSIPEAQNDMILVVICEELGVFGALIILILFGLLLYRLMFIAQNAPDLFGSLIATGIFAHIALQVIFNIAVVTGLFPTTGITLPFISYGGTAIVFLLAEMGIALGISRRIRLEG